MEHNQSYISYLIYKFCWIILLRVLDKLYTEEGICEIMSYTWYGLGDLTLKRPCAT